MTKCSECDPFMERDAVTRCERCGAALCRSCTSTHHARCLPAKASHRGEASRMAAHNAVRRAGGSPREAIRAYCEGNVWLTENAKAVGNW